MTEFAPSADRIFVSYRRDDAAYPAGWLVDRLAGRFGAAQVFKDVDSIQLGDDFERDIMAAVGSCAVLLAVIGARWLTVTGNDGRRRIDDPGDYVRVEIEAALARDVRVIPVLVDGARMPTAADLPPSLAGLARRQALELSPASFDTSRLFEVLGSTLSATTPADAAHPADSLPGTAHGPADATVQQDPSLMPANDSPPADPNPQDMTRTAVISVRRRSEWNGAAAVWIVLIDGKSVGQIRGQQPQEYPVAPGTHRIQVKVNPRWGGYSSQVEVVTLNVGERAAFICRVTRPVSLKEAVGNAFSLSKWKEQLAAKDDYVTLDRE